MPEKAVHEATSMARISCIVLLSSLCGFLQ